MAWPGGGNGLPHGLHGIGDAEVREAFFNGRGDVVGGETHGRDIRGIAVAQPRTVSLHQGHGRPQGVWHVHHVKTGVGLEKAGIVSVLQGGVVYFYGVIGGAAAWRGDRGN